MNLNFKKIIIAFIFLALNFLFFYGAIFFAFSGIRESFNDILKIRGQILNIQERQRNLDDLEAAFREVEKEAIALDKVFFNKKEAIGLIIRLEKLGEDFGLRETIQTSDGKIIEESFKIKGKDGLLSFFPMQIEVIGGFSDVFKFIRALEHFDYLVKVNNLQIRRLESKDFSLSSGRFSGAEEGDVSATVSIGVLLKPQADSNGN